MAAHVLDKDALSVSDAAGSAPRARLDALLAHLVSVRGEIEAPVDPSLDDVVDPYRREWDVYEQMASELMPALGETVRLLAVAVRP